MNWSQFVRDAATLATAYNTYQTSVKMDTLNDSLNDFKNQTSAELSKLTATMERGFSMLSLELAVQSQIFKNILNVLKEKRKTEAEELKNFGLKALRNGWIKDAIDDFTKSLDLNRYDYQVYYLLSKCYFLLNDIEQQNNYLQMSFQYAAEDNKFRQYVGLDIVGQLVKEKKFEDARLVVKYLEGLMGEEVDITPLLMCKIYIDIFSGDFSDSTLVLVDKAIENYEGDEPSRIITVIKALSNFVKDDQQRYRADSDLFIHKCRQ
jgi:tetratricopeptide (TPR) repeat protein